MCTQDMLSLIKKTHISLEGIEEDLNAWSAARKKKHAPSRSGGSGGNSAPADRPDISLVQRLHRTYTHIHAVDIRTHTYIHIYTRAHTL